MRGLVALLLVCRVADASGSHCHETSPIVGREHCAGFGARWAHDGWFGLIVYEVALAYEHVAIDPIDARGRVFSATQTAGYHIGLADGTRHHFDGLGPRMRFGYRAPHLTFVFEITAAFPLASPTTVTEVEGFAPAPGSGGSLFDLAGVAGYHRRWGALQVGGELATGVRTIVLDGAPPPGFTTCAGGATGKNCYLAPWDDRLLVEPRARVDWWVTPQLALGLSGGIDVAARGESLSLMIGYHLAAYDGD